MTTQIMATVIDGILKPDQPLQLAEQTRVKLTVEPIDEWTPEKALRAMAAFKEWVKAHPLHLGGKRWTRDELYDRS